MVYVIWMTLVFRKRDDKLWWLNNTTSETGDLPEQGTRLPTQWSQNTNYIYCYCWDEIAWVCIFEDSYLNFYVPSLWQNFIRNSYILLKTDCYLLDSVTQIELMRFGKLSTKQSKHLSLTAYTLERLKGTKKQDTRGLLQTSLQIHWFVFCDYSYYIIHS